jgi:putative transposase
VSEARKPVPKLAEWLERTAHETLTFLDHSAPEHRRLLKTINSMEHDHAEVRRRSRVVRIFSNEASLVRLLGALAIERNEQLMERTYMVFKQDPSTKDVEVTQVA